MDKTQYLKNTLNEQFDVKSCGYIKEKCKYVIIITPKNNKSISKEYIKYSLYDILYFNESLILKTIHNVKNTLDYIIILEEKF